jgi:hypothetical protein
MLVEMYNTLNIPEYTKIWALLSQPLVAVHTCYSHRNVNVGKEIRSEQMQ